MPDSEFQCQGDKKTFTDEQGIAMPARGRANAASAAPHPSGLRVSFRNSRGLRLVGRLLVPPSGGPHPVVVVAHGWGSGKDSPRNRAVAEALQAAGYAAFLFDFTGHGESEGTEEESTLAQQVDDLGVALSVLERIDEVDPGRIAVLGSSSGAAAALSRAAEDPRIRALVLRSGNPAGAEAGAPRVTVPTLLVVGKQDEPIRTAHDELLMRLGGPRRLTPVPQGHDFFEIVPEPFQHAIALTLAWLDEHLK